MIIQPNTNIVASEGIALNQRHYLPRHQYGARLEPLGILHGIGQSEASFTRYCFEMAPVYPRVKMAYAGLNGMTRSRSDRMLRYWRDMLDAQPWENALQIGLGMGYDGNPEKHYEQDVAKGEYDEQIEVFWELLAALEVPIYLRIGFEFNGRWNGYEPDSYIEAFRRLAAGRGDLPVANVWCASVEGHMNPFDFYPGDDVVDWWGNDYFDVEHFEDEVAQRLLDEAHRHGKPVMIGESTPRHVGVLDGQGSWDRWFEPYFQLMANNPGIKLFSYINWDWQGRRAGDISDWSDWGNGRLECNEAVLEHWKGEMANPIFEHAGSPLS